MGQFVAGQYVGETKNLPQKVNLGPICRVIDIPVPKPLACCLTNDVDGVDVVDIIDIIDVVDVVDEGCEMI